MTHGSELQGQEEAGRMRQTSELFGTYYSTERNQNGTPVP